MVTAKSTADDKCIFALKFRITKSILRSAFRMWPLILYSFTRFFQYAYYTLYITVLPLTVQNIDQWHLVNGREEHECIELPG